MDKFAIITGSLGVLFGAYGAWRAWRTDRSLKILGKKWEIIPHGRDKYLFRNLQPRIVYGVEISGPDGHVIDILGGNGEYGLKPNETLQVMVRLLYRPDFGPLDVTWHCRADCSDDPRIWSGHLPAANENG